MPFEWLIYARSDPPRRNFDITTARDDIVVFLDDDTRCDSGCSYRGKPCG